MVAKQIANAAKKVVKKAVHVAKVANAGRKFIKTATSPYQLAKVGINAIRGEGIVFPGSKYIGPGNRMDKGAPTSKADAAAYQHDVDYDNYIKKGVKKKDVYLGYSDADERLYRKSKKNLDTASGWATFAGMGAKKLLNKTGLTKRIRDRKVYGRSGPPDQGATPLTRQQARTKSAIKIAKKLQNAQKK